MLWWVFHSQASLVQMFLTLIFTELQFLMAEEGLVLVQ
jgi:hypothetical protein